MIIQVPHKKELDPTNIKQDNKKQDNKKQNNIKKISIVLAVHNESENIPQVMNSIKRAVQIIRDRYIVEIIAVNDGSTDRSLYMLDRERRDNPFLTVIDHPFKKGMTAVVTSAMERASGEILIFSPADMESHPDEDIPKLLGVLEKGYDVAAGMRVGRKDGKSTSSMIGNKIISTCFKLRLHDINWIKAMTREAADTMVLKHGWVRYMLLFPHFHGMKISEVETNWYQRTYGKSKFGTMRLIESLKDLLILTFCYLKGDFSRKIL